MTRFADLPRGARFRFDYAELPPQVRIGVPIGPFLKVDDHRYADTQDVRGMMVEVGDLRLRVIVVRGTSEPEPAAEPKLVYSRNGGKRSGAESR